MRRRGASVRVLEGQVVLAQVVSGDVKLDCILAEAGAPTGLPVTIQATIPDATETRDIALDMIEEWADEVTLIGVTI